MELAELIGSLIDQAKEGLQFPPIRGVPSPPVMCGRANKPNWEQWEGQTRRENDPNGEITDFINKKKFLKRARDNTKNENEGQMNIWGEIRIRAIVNQCYENDKSENSFSFYLVTHSLLSFRLFVHLSFSHAFRWSNQRFSSQSNREILF